MAVLNDSTRRFLTLVLFILLGPSLLFLVGYKLFARNSGNSLVTEERRLSQFIEGSLHFSNREYLRPGAQRFLNVSFSSESNEDVAFCPEVYLIEEDNPEFIRKYASSFDTPSDQTSSADIANEENESSSHCFVDDTSEKTLEIKRQSFEKLLFSNESNNVSLTSAFESQTKKYSLIVIPTVLCRDDRLLEVKATLMNLIYRTAPTSKENKRIVGLAIGNFRIVKSNEIFLPINQEISRKSNQELAAYFSVASSSLPLVSPQRSDEEIEEKIRLLESETPCVNNIKILYVGSKRNARVGATFEFDKLYQEGEPRHYISIETDKDHSSILIDFNAPTPVSLMAQFVPFFQQFGQTCWFSGQLVGNFFSSEHGFVSARSEQFQQVEEKETEKTTVDVPLWSVRLKDAHFQNCDLTSINAQTNLPEFTGKISDLSIDKGTIRQGVFEGTGTICIQDGTVPTDVLSRLCRTNCLEVVPSTALNYRFINDSVPFNEFELQFKMNKNGIVFDSKYPNKIVACYEKGNVKYGFFLPQTTAGRVLPYARPLFALVDSTEEDVFRTPLFKSALNHLPVTSTAATLDQDNYTLRR